MTHGETRVRQAIDQAISDLALAKAHLNIGREHSLDCAHSAIYVARVELDYAAREALDELRLRRAAVEAVQMLADWTAK